LRARSFHDLLNIHPDPQAYAHHQNHLSWFCKDFFDAVEVTQNQDSVPF